jgi:hypothetical protein
MKHYDDIIDSKKNITPRVCSVAILVLQSWSHIDDICNVMGGRGGGCLLRPRAPSIQQCRCEGVNRRDDQRRWDKRTPLTDAILVHDIDTKLEVVILIEFKRFTLCVFGAKSPSIQECSVA